VHSSPRSADKAQEVIKRITSLPHQPKAFAVCGDLKTTTAPDAIVAATREWLKSQGKEDKINILVNNAGVELVRPLGQITPEDFAGVYDVNVRAPLLMTQAVLPYLPAASRVINISSVGSRAAFSGLSIYCSSKAAVEGLTRCFATELGHNGTTVNAVLPGPVQSDMLDNIPQAVIDIQKNNTPLQKRLGTVEEIAAVVAFLASEDGRWITGQSISSSGGWAMF
jgi:3-oxoacyl-[acyl-carrier protein] reductase